MEFKEQIELAINKEMCKHAFYAGTNVDDINLDELFEDWWSDKMFELRAVANVDTGDRQLTIPDVSHQRELLLAFVEYYNNYCKGVDELYISEVESFLEESQ